MSSITSKKLPYVAAVQFKEMFYEPNPEIGYISIGKHTPFLNVAELPSIDDTVSEEKAFWDNMYAAKKITGSDVELVIPRINWQYQTRYKQYDDLISLEKQTVTDEKGVYSITANANSHGVNGFVIFTSTNSSNVAANARIFVYSNNLVKNVVVYSNGVYDRDDTIVATPNTGNAVFNITTSRSNIQPMYIFTSERNVYKCLSNNNSELSTVEPTGDYTSSNGIISTPDGYIWKYMYNVKPSNKFLTEDWIPVPASTNQLDYGVSPIGTLDGELTTIVVTDSGGAYYENDIEIVQPFPTDCTTLILANTTHVAANMFISGTGISPETYITELIPPVDGIYRITLSANTNGPGGSPGSNIAKLSTRVYINGDGSKVVAVPIITDDPSKNVEKITVTTVGTNYSFANVFIYGTSSNASARAILDIKYGHAVNPAKELGCNSTMVSVRVGEIDTTEGGKIPANTTFRQIGLFINPHKYGDESVVFQKNASPVISQTTRLSLIAGSRYTTGELVYQGFPNNAIAYGYVLSQTTSEVELTNVRGTFITGVSVIGSISGVNRLLASYGNPEFQPYSGDMLYMENNYPTQRSDGQAENIRLVVRF